jgi:hypothetical protein
MRNDPVISSMEKLYDSAKAGGVLTAQQQQLILTYGTSLLRRRHEQLMRRQDEVDEIRIALVGRAPPIFRFIASEKACKVRSVKCADAKLKGSIKGTVALIGG